MLAAQVRTLDAWLLFLVGAVDIGAGAMLTTNLAFIIQAAHAPDHLVTSTGTTFATGNLLGRLLTPVVSEALLVRRGRARAWLLLPIALTQGSAHLALLVAGSAQVAAGSAMQQALLIIGAGASGGAFGAIWPSLVILSSELFGRRHLMLNYLFYDGGCGCVGNLILANLLSSYVYEHAQSEQRDAASAHHLDAMSAHRALRVAAASNGTSASCYGPDCFRTSHVVVIGLCGAAVLAAAALAVRSRALYQLKGGLATTTDGH